MTIDEAKNALKDIKNLLVFKHEDKDGMPLGYMTCLFDSEVDKHPRDQQYHKTLEDAVEYRTGQTK